MSAIVFAHRNEAPHVYSEGYLAGIEPVFGQLQAAGIEVVQTSNAEAAFTDQNVIGLTHNQGERNQRSLPHEQVGGIVNVLHRNVKLELLPESQRAPWINQNNVRTLGYHKQMMHDQVLLPLGLGIPTVLADSKPAVESFLAQQSTDSFIAKLNRGAGTNSTQILDRQQINAELTSQEWQEKPRVLQPAFDFTRPFPNSIRAYDTTAQENFNTFSNGDTVKEMRMYCFQALGETAVFPVGRNMGEGPNWFFVDPESLPEKLAEETARIATQVGAVTDTKSLYSAVDFGYGAMGSEDADWHVIEGNIRSPHMILEKAHAGVAMVLRKLFAEQLIITADQANKSV